ncbi:MAG: thioredoxin domain-containing protein [Gammaproteobacteria bacterium]|nr:thioredoxin domain-containing protein [Gammaproteobacteria bacterium]
MLHEQYKTELLLKAQDHVLGPPSAAVIIVEYGDFGCAYCRSAYSTVKILLDHFKDRVRFAFRHYPVVEAHPRAERAAEAAESAGVQGKFWPMHDLLFENQLRLEDTHLRQYAQMAKLDLQRYDRDMQTHVYLPYVRTQRDEARALGTHGTPTFFVNGVIEDVSFGMENLHKAIELNLQPANMK